MDRPLNLIPAVQHYAWGMKSSCAVKEFAGSRAGEPPYAELWYGVHPHGSAGVPTPDGMMQLDRLIAAHPEALLGERTAARFGPSLPFLLKILSVAAPLSIQAHPDRETAAELHRRDPAHYPDENHKPEMGLALSPFELLHGLRPAVELSAALARAPELRRLIGPPDALSAADPHAALAALLSAPAADVEAASLQLFRRLKAVPYPSPEEEWILRLEERFPSGDAGLFCFYLMKLIKLAPGEAIFTPPGLPHAYLRGELIECMASSDNVTRAALTGKFRDIQSLLAVIGAGSESSGRVPVSAEKINSLEIIRYPTRAEEFELARICGSSEGAEFTPAGAPEIILCLKGSGRLCGPGFDAALTRTEAYLIPGGCRSCRLALRDAELIRASVP